MTSEAPATPPTTLRESDVEGLRTPALLIALPQVIDPFFHKSVVLLIHHTDEGSVGLIVNRPTELSMEDVLADMEIPWGGESEAPSWFGGPVQPQVGTILYAPPQDNGGGPAVEGATPVTAGIALTQHVGDLGRLAPSPPPRFRLLLGYAGWGEGQLLEEILRNDWLIAPVDPELVFSESPDEAWAGALRSVGVDPSALPSWTTPGADGGDAN